MTLAGIQPDTPQTGEREPTLKEAVLELVKKSYDLHGLDGLTEVMDEFKKAKVLFAGNCYWHVIEDEVMVFMKEKYEEKRRFDAERQQKIYETMLAGLSKGMSGSQVNFLTGNNPQASYFSLSTSNLGGHNQ